MKTHVNLMTDDNRRQQILNNAKRLWSRVLSVTLLVLLVAGAVQWWRGTATTAQLHRLEDRYAPIQTLKNECIRMRTGINAMRDAQQLTLRLVDTRPTITLLGAISSATAAAAGDVYVNNFELQRNPTASDLHVAVVSGQGKNNLAIARFTEALRESNLFADVSLSSSNTASATDQQARSFRIECQL